MRRRPLPRRVARLVLVLCLAPAPATAADWVVNVYSDAFDPPRLAAAVGDTVTWVRRTPARHDVRFSGDPGGGPGALHRSLGTAPVTVTLRRAGRFPYVCAIHGMRGVLEVAPAPGP